MLMRDLASAGAAITARQNVEDRLHGAVTHIVRVFLARVRADALGALDAPVLLAAGRAPFSLNNVASLWETASRDILTEVVHATGSTTRGGVLSRYERTVLGRLAGSPITGAAYDAVRETLTESVEQSWTKNRTEEALRSTLAPDGSAAVRTADGLTESGRSWQAVADGIARTEATSAFAESTRADLAVAGTERQRWVAHHDRHTRETHLAADGQTVRVGDSFIVGGYALAYPGDPAGPAAETYNCRCVLVAGS